ncbi:MAG: acyl-CoA dehydrogenase family protein [Rhodococcus sp. (in: high G+C Gram-positive bacteria)]
MISHESEERSMLRASVRALISRHSDPTAVRAVLASGTGHDASLWNRMHSAIGGVAVMIDEEYGGGGGTVGDLVVVLDELGAGLVPSPMLGTAFAAAAISANADGDSRARLLPLFVDRAVSAAVLVDSTAVVDGAAAEILLGIVDGRLVEFDTTTVTVRPEISMDPTRSVASVGTAGGTTTDLGPAGSTLDLALLFSAAEQVGAARRCLNLTVEYTSTRVQFGRPVGSFQALKHRMADLYGNVEVARALVYDAADTLDTDAVTAASVIATETLTEVAAEAVQMHGGIGVTWEHDISLYFKRAHGSRYLFTSPRERRNRLATAAGL